MPTFNNTTKVHVHNQSVASTVWSITHNLGCKPVVEVTLDTNNGRVKAFPSKVIHETDNQMKIEFSVARTGVARLVGLVVVQVEA